MITGIVIVLFNPDVNHVSGILEAFPSSEWDVVLVDNSPVRTQSFASSQVKYIHFPENVGIAKAQNVGLEALFDHGVEYAFLLDQDSFFSPVIARELLSQFLALEKSCPIAAIGPSIHCQFSDCVEQGVLQKGKQVSDSLKQVKQIIASGMLISHRAFKKVGGKENALFIDGVDHEWCWRARAKGMVIYQSLSACMPHRQGDNRIKVCGVTFKQGAPIRLYYQFRNVLILARRPYVPLYWKLRHVFAIPLRYIVNRYCFDEGKERGCFMRAGFKDGALHRTGSLDARQNGSS
ncbi:glycosyltransferase family 2 protein [Alteromonas sp. IB21]|uniref:glycosyltransferase family 2 protein n=1 Tax=Alteromonas sp. IB21 TaxID=2779369 RepID=UPI0018E84C13|nr:glycosyltransferase family 2 protein [Alteromonas sp. IB21]MBJ2128102.1 glycosyltransferase family 2 protein [Alteromonas sp. IB21]